MRNNYTFVQLYSMTWCKNEVWFAVFDCTVGVKHTTWIRINILILIYELCLKTILQTKQSTLCSAMFVLLKVLVDFHQQPV